MSDKNSSRLLVEALVEAARALHAAGHDAEAVQRLDRALGLDPDYGPAAFTLGIVALSAGRVQEAIAAFEAAIRLQPDDALTHYNLGLALQTAGQPRAAMRRYRAALRLDGGLAMAHNNLGTALAQVGDSERALAHYRRALRIEPQFADAQANMGNALRELGRIEDAEACCERALALEPNRPHFYLNLASVRTFQPDDRYVAAMQRLATATSQLSETEEIELHFALAKALDDVRWFDEAGEHLLRGNALKRAQFTYDETVTAESFEQLKATSGAAAGEGWPSDVPVFIVGMPRSGTSLVEQILASHPAVFGAGELETFARLQAQGGSPRKIGEAYVRELRHRAPAAARVTDKMPLNFRYLGLVHQALPNARIIHIRRDAVDTCLSCFATLFAGDMPFAYDLGELGRYYRLYESLMAHWRRVLPASTLVEIGYEDLVADLPAVTRRMLAHCGLAWDDACLTFNQTRRPVRTASATQVRRPLTSAGIGRWHAYGTLLPELLHALGRNMP